jgi:hypothetical protein
MSMIRIQVSIFWRLDPSTWFALSLLFSPSLLRSQYSSSIAEDATCVSFRNLQQSLISQRLYLKVNSFLEGGFSGCFYFSTNKIENGTMGKKQPFNPVLALSIFDAESPRA